MLQNTRKDLFLPLVLAGTGGIVLFLNLLTPMTADDYFYACCLGYAEDGTLIPVRRLQGIPDILLSQKCVYMAHSGRIPVLASVQLFTLLPDFIFDLCNTLMFLLLLDLLARLSRPRSRRRTALTMAGAGLLIWQCTPAFGQDLLWHTGSLNYLWTMTVTLAFLLQCLQPHPAPGAAAFFGLGFASGWSMENQSAAACCLCLICLFHRWRQEHCLSRPLAAGAAGQLAGFALLLLAPGNYRRSAGYGQPGLVPTALLDRLAQDTKAFWQEYSGLIVLTALLMVLVLLRSPRRAALPLWLLGGAVLCHLSMAFSPSYPMRSMFGSEIFLIAALLACLNLPDGRKVLLPILCIGLGVGMAVSFPAAVRDLHQLHDLTRERARWILEQRAEGNRDVTVPVAAARTRFNPLWGDGLSDLMQNPTNERNRSLAFYYDVDIIRGDPDL